MTRHSVLARGCARCTARLAASSSPRWWRAARTSRTASLHCCHSRETCRSMDASRLSPATWARESASQRMDSRPERCVWLSHCSVSLSGVSLPATAPPSSGCWSSLHRSEHIPVEAEEVVPAERDQLIGPHPGVCLSDALPAGDERRDQVDEAGAESVLVIAGVEQWMHHPLSHREPGALE